ncbi:LLM class flavin-dependent oxidoreductase [Sphingosinicella ginsenosidimutans]|uniref:Luciferase-like monooxygenase n=1 Tax=Allosphingosinicella ginsenosidimutans TaxID=1176539 RepID=A0A5C6TXG4_9SPHN|nr:LLM class flavin-dependent oxidoreductase [Sphingosinicella ginsenosidimutans]TXC64595.1 LLM class flavin-dependent oxidoreductase [Sphingosinicella ginsenosidimutans]
MIPFSILDLAPIVEGGDARQALLNSRDLARHAERWGYKRFWMAEHHSMPGIASAATAVALAFVGEGTSTIRIGAGGIMLPNHAPLIIAEQFGTLESLFPGRIDLGLGRAPGTDQAAAYAMRRNLASDEHQFPRDVVELMDYFKGGEDKRVRAFPGEGLDIPVWILGSSLFGAQLAAMLGLPYAFASHFAPAAMMDAIRVYRERFQPSAQLDRPYVMLGFNAFAADTDEEAQLLATSVQQAVVSLRTGRPTRLPPPMKDYAETLPPGARAIVDNFLTCSAIGSPATVKAAIEEFVARTGADELMITAQIFDHSARLRSYETVAGLFAG